jgi:hypothetical protein
MAKSGVGYLRILADGNMGHGAAVCRILALTVLGIVLFSPHRPVERLMLPPYAAEHASLAHETM